MFGNVWRQIKEFSAVGGNATYLLPRWIVLRAVGVLYIIVFAGIIAESQALIGPHGIAPLAGFLDPLAKAHPNPLGAFLRAPSLFWISTSSPMIALLGWAGLVAAAALVLNLWPRLALFACWLIFLSFVATWRQFSGSQVDELLLETGLLCIPFAPAGFRPGLGAGSPPRPIAVFMMRWLLFRVMLESGLLKLASGDPYWRNLTAMNIMYETTPFPTILGYLDHQMPQAYHVFEYGLTFAAEIAAPLLALLGGRRGRWFAFGVWTVFQIGIQLTNNFGWLNTASIALGVLLLDDQMLAGAADKLGLWRFGNFLALKGRGAFSSPATTVWSLYALRVALGAQFCLTLYFFGAVWEDAVYNIQHPVASPLAFASSFHSANVYHLYARMAPVRYGVEFEGSNDGGATWRTYEFRYQPQRTDRISPFIAPLYPRFEATLQIAVFSAPKSPIFPAVAAELISRNPDVMRLFRNDPFPDRPPTMVRMPVYRLAFTDLATRRRTRNFWNKEYEGDYLPMVYLDEHGQLAGGG